MTLRDAGLGGPIYCVADDDSVGRFAPAWAAAFSAVGWIHRVRVIAAHTHSAAEADEMVAEARRFGAAVILAAGAGHGIGRRVAGASGLPLVEFPSGAMHAPAASPADPRPAD